MSLVSPADARVYLNTSISDVDLQSIIDRIEGQINARIGAPQNGEFTVEVTKTLRGEGSDLYLPTHVYAVTSIVEDGTTLDAEDYQLWSAGVIERLPDGAHWGDRCAVTYKPSDDRFRRTPVIIDLLRLTLERTALKSESIGGEYSYSAPDNWDAEFRRVMKTLEFQTV